MADEILPPSVLCRRLNDEVIRGGFSLATYNKIIKFANSLSKQEIGDFLFLADSCYSAYLKIEKLVSANNSDAKELYSEFHTRITSGMSGALRNYTPYCISGLGALLTFITSILMTVETNVTEGKEQKDWKISDGIIRSALTLFSLVTIITGVVNNAGNYNDQMIKLIKKVVELRLSGIKYLESIKNNYASKGEELILRLENEYKSNEESKSLIELLKEIVKSEELADHYNMDIKENWITKKRIFCSKKDIKDRNKGFSLETEGLLDEIIKQIGTPIRPATPPEVVVKNDRGRSDSFVQRRIKQLNQSSNS